MNRRGFLKSLIGALGGGAKVLSALATPQTAATVARSLPGCLEAGYFYADYVPILCTPTFHDFMKLTPSQLGYFQRMNWDVYKVRKAEPPKESITDEGMALRQRRVR